MHRLSATQYIIRTLVALFVAQLPCAAYSQSSIQIRNQVREGIENLVDIGPHDIAADVHQGYVELSGYVRTQAIRQQVEKMVTEIEGVTQVDNNLEVRGKLESTQEGQRIIDAIKARLRDDTALTGYQISIKVQAGRVLLSGQVTEASDIKRIVALTKKVSGVTLVEDQLKVTTGFSDDELRTRVLLSLSRQLGIRDIAVDVDDGIVTIFGERTNHRQIDRILSVILMVDGVREAKSEVELKGN